MPRTSSVHAVTTIGMDMGKNTLHMIGLDSRGAIVLREKVSRGRITSRLANLPPCLIGIEAGMATHYVARELAALGHDVKQVPPAYAKPFRQGHKNDFRDAHAVAEAVQRPTTRFVPTKTDEQLDLQALHRVRSRLVSERTAVINQIRGFLLERGIIVRQGLRLQRSAVARHSQEVGIFRPGSGSSLSRCRPETEPSSGASPSAATVTCARSSCKLPGSFCCGR